MADLIAIGYDDETTAIDAMGEAQRLQQDLVIQADAVAAIVRDTDGSYHTHTTQTPIHRAGSDVGHVLGDAVRPAVLHPGVWDGDRRRLWRPLWAHGQKGDRQTVPRAGARHAQARHLLLVHDHREGHPRQSRRRAQPNTAAPSSKRRYPKKTPRSSKKNYTAPAGSSGLPTRSLVPTQAAQTATEGTEQEETIRIARHA